MNLWLLIALGLVAYLVGDWIGTRIVLYIADKSDVHGVTKSEAGRMAGFMGAAAGITGALQGFAEESFIFWLALLPVDYLLVWFGAWKILRARNKAAHSFSIRYMLAFFIPLSLVVSAIIVALTSSG